MCHKFRVIRRKRRAWLSTNKCKDETYMSKNAADGWLSLRGVLGRPSPGPTSASNGAPSRLDTFSGSHMTGSPAFSCDAHHHRSSRQQLAVVLGLRLIADSEGPSLISFAASHLLFLLVCSGTRSGLSL